MQEFDRVVIGASFFGCGLAVRLGGAKILEPSCVVGADFALTFNGGEGWDAEPEHPEAREYLSMLRAHRALDDEGRTAVAALAPLLAGVLAMGSSLKNAMQIITLSAWSVGLVTLGLVLLVIPKDVHRLREIMASRAQEAR